MASRPGSYASLYSPKAMLQRRIVSGARQGSRLWFAVGAGLWVGGVIRRAVARQEAVAAVERLKPGQSITIVTIPVPSRRQQRAAARKAADH